MIIENHIQLEDFLRIKFKQKVFMRLPYFSDIENETMEIKLNSLINECGCKYGGYFFSVGILIFTSSLFYSSLSLFSNIIFFIGVLLFSLFGKFLGIGMAKNNLKAEVTEIIKIARQRASIHDPLITCRTA